MRARVLALVGGSCVGLVGLIGLLHTPYGRPLMRHLGMACPAAKVSPGEVEAVRLRAVAALRTEVPSPARPAAGQTLDVSRAADVIAWARARGLACVEAARPSHTIKCEGSIGAPARDSRVPPVDQNRVRLRPRRTAGQRRSTAEPADRDGGVTPVRPGRRRSGGRAGAGTAGRRRDASLPGVRFDARRAARLPLLRLPGDRHGHERLRPHRDARTVRIRPRRVDRFI